MSSEDKGNIFYEEKMEYHVHVQTVCTRPSPRFLGGAWVCGYYVTRFLICHPNGNVSCSSEISQILSPLLFWQSLYSQRFLLTCIQSTLLALAPWFYQPLYPMKKWNLWVVYEYAMFIVVVHMYVVVEMWFLTYTVPSCGHQCFISHKNVHFILLFVVVQNYMLDSVLTPSEVLCSCCFFYWFTYVHTHVHTLKHIAVYKQINLYKAFFFLSYVRKQQFLSTCTCNYSYSEFKVQGATFSRYS